MVDWDLEHAEASGESGHFKGAPLHNAHPPRREADASVIRLQLHLSLHLRPFARLSCPGQVESFHVQLVPPRIQHLSGSRCRTECQRFVSAGSSDAGSTSCWRTLPMPSSTPVSSQPSFPSKRSSPRTKTSCRCASLSASATPLGWAKIRPAASQSIRSCGRSSVCKGPLEIRLGVSVSIRRTRACRISRADRPVICSSTGWGVPHCP
jgi:hypothetical protein